MTRSVPAAILRGAQGRAPQDDGSALPPDRFPRVAIDGRKLIDHNHPCKQQ
jgi:hypothetical protein